MAVYNKLLGVFNLDGIPPAPRGMPQIEVTFDIDANGVVNVSATDKGTGKEQRITIQSSGGLSEEEIQKMMKDAEANASADKAKKEMADAKNQADTLIYSTEKSLTDLGDKVSSEDKTKAENEIKELKEALEKDNIDDIKTKKEALEKTAMAFAQKVYEDIAKQQQEAQNNTDNTSDKKDDTIDAEYEEK